MGGPTNRRSPICPVHPKVPPDDPGMTIDECQCWEHISRSELVIDPNTTGDHWGATWLRVIPEGRNLMHNSNRDRLAIAIQVTERTTEDDVREAFTYAMRWKEALNRYQGRIGIDALWEWIISTGATPARVRDWFQSSFLYYVEREIDLQEIERTPLACSTDIDPRTEEWVEAARLLSVEALAGYPHRDVPARELPESLPADAPRPCLVAHPSRAWTHRWMHMAHFLWEAVDRGRPLFPSGEQPDSEQISTTTAIDLVRENIACGAAPLFGIGFPGRERVREALRIWKKHSESGTTLRQPPRRT